MSWVQWFVIDFLCFHLLFSTWGQEWSVKLKSLNYNIVSCSIIPIVWNYPLVWSYPIRQYLLFPLVIFSIFWIDSMALKCNAHWNLVFQTCEWVKVAGNIFICNKLKNIHKLTKIFLKKLPVVKLLNCFDDELPLLVVGKKLFCIFEVILSILWLRVYNQW